VSSIVEPVSSPTAVARRRCSRYAWNAARPSGERDERHLRGRIREPDIVENLLQVARFRAVARSAGLSEVAVQGNHVRFGPVKLADWQRVRLNRIYPKSLVKEAAATMLVPRPKTAPVGGKPLRDLELLSWARAVVDDVLVDAPR
jgi:hypothetical protein